MKGYRKFNGKEYRYRASFPQKVAKQVAKELKQRGLRVRIIRERKRTLGIYFYGVWQRPGG